MNIWVNGCFDIIHSGHIDLLWYAKRFKSHDNKLIVGLDEDERIRLTKGKNRPINNILERIKIMENLKMVDEVVTFNSDDELKNLILEYNIDYIIIGDQYKDRKIIGRENSNFGIHLYPVNEYSTTNIINKITNNGD